MSRTEQAIRFLTDAVGLERLLRGLQSILQILAAQPLMLSLFLNLLSAIGLCTPSPEVEKAALVLPVIGALKRQLAITRRFFRAFRWADSFHGAQKILFPFSPPPSPLTVPSTGGSQAKAEQQQEEKKPGVNIPSANKPSLHMGDYLSVLAKTFNGLYLLFEAATLGDALGIEGFAPLGPDLAGWMGIEAQRFWFFALLCGVLGSGWGILDVLAHTPVPATGQGFGGSLSEGKEVEAGKDQAGQDAEMDFDAERKRLRELVKRRKKARKLWRRTVKKGISKLSWRMLSDGLDLVLPGKVIGWIMVDEATAGWAMLVTTVVTGWDRWESLADADGVGGGEADEGGDE